MKVPSDFRGSERAAEVLNELLTFLDDIVIPMEKEAGLKWGEKPPRELLERVWKTSSEAGHYSLLLPKELGGAGLSTRDFCAVKCEAYAHGSQLVAHVLGELTGPPRVGHLFKVATDDQIERFLSKVSSAEKNVCFALTEQGAGSDAVSIKTNAVRDGNHYIINGHKRFISGGPYADFAILLAVTDPEAGARGISAFFVDLDGPGCSVDSDYEVLTGQRSHADLIFKDARVPLTNLIGQEGAGFKLAMGRITVNRLLHCATMLGQAKLVTKLSIQRAQTRQQFGKPIGMFQAIQHMIANMSTDLYAAHSMMLDAAAQQDAGHDIRKEASMAKVFCSEKAFEIADRAVQVHGGMGLLKGGAPEYIFRTLRMYRIVTGTSEIQRSTIAKELLLPKGMKVPK